MYQIAFSLERRIDGELVLIDSRGLASLDLAALFAFINNDAQFASLIQLGFAIATNVDVSAIVRLEDANLMCYENGITDAHIDSILLAIRGLYRDIQPGMCMLLYMTSYVCLEYDAHLQECELRAHSMHVSQTA